MCSKKGKGEKWVSRDIEKSIRESMGRIVNYLKIPVNVTSH